jgi:hypothetical protein
MFDMSSSYSNTTKITMRYKYISTRLAKIQKTDIPNVGEAVEKLEP